MKPTVCTLLFVLIFLPKFRLEDLRDCFLKIDGANDSNSVLLNKVAWNLASHSVSVNDASKETCATSLKFVSPWKVEISQNNSGIFNSELLPSYEIDVSCADEVPVQILDYLLLTTLSAKSAAKITIVTEPSDFVSSEIVQRLSLDQLGVETEVVNLDTFIKSSTNVNNLKDLTKIDRIVFLVCQLECISRVLPSFEGHGFLTSTYKWLIYHPRVSISQIEHIEKSFRITLVETTTDENLFLDAQKTNISQNLAQNILNFPQKPKISLDKNYCRSKIYNKKFLLPGWEKTGDFPTTASASEVQLTKEPFSKKFHKFENGKVFVVDSLAYSIFQRKIVDNVTKTDKWVGLSFEILNELARDLNFRYVVREPADGKWGARAKQDDGSFIWNGMVGDVVRGECDFAAAGFSVTSQRKEVVDFASAYFHEQTVVVIKKPEPEDKIWLFSKPFQPIVWAVIAGSITAASVIFLISNRANVLYNHLFLHDTATINSIRSVAYVAHYFVCAVIQEGHSYLPPAHSGRVMLAGWWIFSLILCATYTGNLVAFLAVSFVEMPFKRVDEMVEQTEYKWGMPGGVALNNLFMESSFPVYRKIWAGTSLFKSYKMGYEKLNEKYAFITEKTWVEEQNAKGCNMSMLAEEFFPTNYAWALPVGSPLVELFSEKINMMREAGLLSRWLDKWRPSSLRCTGLQPTASAVTADFQVVKGAFAILGLGAAFALFLFACEYIRHQYVHKRCPDCQEDNHWRHANTGCTVSTTHFPHMHNNNSLNSSITSDILRNWDNVRHSSQNQERTGKDRAALGNLMMHRNGGTHSQENRNGSASSILTQVTCVDHGDISKTQRRLV